MNWTTSRRGRKRLGASPFFLGPPQMAPLVNDVGSGHPVLPGFPPYILEGAPPLVSATGTPAQLTVFPPNTEPPPIGTIMPNGQPYTGGPVSNYNCPPGVYCLGSGVGTTPTGTYTQSCQNIFYDPGTDTLTALCEKIDGTFVQSTLLHASQYVAGSIYNSDGTMGGQLITTTTTTPPTPTPGTPPAIAPNGPLPPGAGYQQAELPGSPYPYIYIGGGTGAGVNAQGLPWSLYTVYNVGDTVSYGGITWTAIQASQGVTPGSDGGLYWYSAYNAYGTSLYPGGYPNSLYPTGYSTPTPLPASSSGISSFSSFFSQYEGWIIAGLAAAIILPRVLKSGGR